MLPIHGLPPCASMIHVSVANDVSTWVYKDLPLMIVTIPSVRPTITLFPSSGKLVFFNIQHMRTCDIVSPRVFWRLDSSVISFFVPLNMTSLWSYGKDLAVFVSDSSDKVMSGTKMFPPDYWEAVFFCI